MISPSSKGMKKELPRRANQAVTSHGGARPVNIERLAGNCLESAIVEEAPSEAGDPRPAVSIFDRYCRTRVGPYTKAAGPGSDR